MRLLVQLVAVGLVAFGGSALVGAVRWNVPLTLVFGLATAALSLFVYARVVRRTERRAPIEVATKGAGPAFGRGLLIGFGMFGAVILNIALLGGYEVRGLGSVAGPVAMIGFTAAAVVVEELIFRGILFRIVEQRFGTWTSLVLSGVLFGAAHLFNPHATLWTATAIAIAGGFMLAAAYAATRTLWVPIGVHFGWNFAQGAIFGTSVSGTEAPQGLLDGVTSGPLLLSGGEFGPEASAYSVLGGVVVTAVFLRLAWKRGNIVRRVPAATLAG
ncbi:CPBP family intramembrane glutamic endopeptidase [Lentzea nigeriaca]|uniref:CPBP family intramembrane glutamic endopeptidase n=1 Tax=Lentzea nigeriaca TaxID=1128665 RepID=UPI0019567BD8|nr:CPBP family intramembrane glutamic endopeptidase [Lentzea nigeriaca]MBM7858706.1 membrane protease YdiL (CAAX protease family) [Lentzea nigeriaca]